MLVECNIWCYDAKHDALTGNKTNVWLPFSFLMDDVRACKLSNDDADSFEFCKATIFYGKKLQEFVIDIDFIAFKEMFKQFHAEKHKSTFTNFTN